jgi:SulP family sulfate permease
MPYRAPLRLGLRYLDALSSAPATLAYGLRTRLRDGYKRSDLVADLMAGLVVGVVALPLSMALAIATGVAPQYGLYTAIVAGIVCAILGGTRCQVTGPTAAFVVILAPIVTKFGLGGLLVAGMMAGILLVLMGAARLGRLIQYIPHPVTTGFTAGIAVVIATIQLKDLFGLHLSHAPESYRERWQLMWEARGSFSPWEFAVGATTIVLLLLVPKILKKIPAPLIVLALMSVIAWAGTRFLPGFHVATIGTQFHPIVNGHEVAGIPPLPPLPLLPWNMGGGNGQPFHLSLDLIEALIPSAFAIAMLGAIESLLAAVVSDGMCGSKHDPNVELMALGIGNILCPFFGGIAATGAIARTATNIRAGARSPFASVIHALFILACTIALAPLVAYLPMAALAGLLILVARNMAELRHFTHIVRVAPRSDALVLFVCFLLTVFFDMVVSVAVGVVLAALLFMRRMAELTDVKLDSETVAKRDLPDGVMVYEVGGPLFFGAAQRAMSAFETVDGRARAVILNLGQVPAIDATGIVALETAIASLQRRGHKVILSGLRTQPAEVVARAGIKRDPGKLALAPDIDAALSLAAVHLARLDMGAVAATS